MPATAPADFSLKDKYALDTTRTYLTAIEALVRLPILQRQRDLQAGHNTAGFISGYRGSPLGGLDQALWKAQSHLDAHDIVFRSGVNEDLDGGPFVSVIGGGKARVPKRGWLTVGPVGRHERHLRRPGVVVNSKCCIQELVK